MSIQAQIINLLMHLQQKLGIALVFVSHDLRVVQHISTHVAVMYLGKVVEYAEKQELFAHPTHPYTQALLSAVPLPDPTRQPERIILQGDLPSPIAVPSGCPFHPRCFCRHGRVCLCRPGSQGHHAERTYLQLPAVRTVSVLRRYFCMNSQYQHAYCQVSGTPFEQGVQQGQELSDAIRRNLASVHRKLEQEKVDLQAYQAFVNQNLRFFQEQRPEMYEERQCIAQGIGLPLDDILLLNIPAYFLCESFRHITQECSMLCVRGQAAADGCTYIIKNRDMGMPMEQALVRHIYPDGQGDHRGGRGRYPHLSRCRHQQPWSGCDHHRLLDREGPHPHRPGGGGRYLPQCAGPPLLLQDRRPSGGVLPHRPPRMNGLNVIAADPTEAYVIEMTSDEIYVEKDEGRGSSSAPTTWSVTSSAISIPRRKTTPPLTSAMTALPRWWKSATAPLRFQDLYRIMSDHTNEPNCICRHPHEGVPATTVSTTLCVVEDREVWTTLQNPCLALPHVQIGEPSAQ